jgi:phenylacetate-CoA ligase
VLAGPVVNEFTAVEASDHRGVKEFGLEVKIPRYAASLDFEALWREFPPPQEYFRGPYQRTRDELRKMQNERFLAQMKRAWEVPFYQRHWRAAAGMEPGDIHSLDDLTKIPPFSVHDLRAGLEEKPFWAEYIGIDPSTDEPIPLIIQTSGGTTGLPRPMIFTPRDREVMNIITGRRLFMQGVRPFDLVQVCLSMGLTNGGVLAREGIWKYTGAVPVMTGSGAQTPTRRQIELIRAWKPKFLIGFPAYLKHMALVARDELNVDPRTLGIKGLIAHLGIEDRKLIEELWGADAFDTYGCNECGTMAAECSHKAGMHVFEDAFVMEVNDRDTLRPKPAGERGVIFITTLFKHAAPMIRYNMNDLTSWGADECACGTHQRSITKIYGRSDNMVKLRGVNVFPEAIGAIVSQDARSNGEYVCILEEGGGGSDDMTVMVEVLDASIPGAELESDLKRRLKEALGVRLNVQAVGRGELDHLTGLSQTSKIKRLIDKRGKRVS